MHCAYSANEPNAYLGDSVAVLEKSVKVVSLAEWKSAYEVNMRRLLPKEIKFRKVECGVVEIVLLKKQPQYKGTAGFELLIQR